MDTFWSRCIFKVQSLFLSFRMKNIAPLKDLHKWWVKEKYKSSDSTLIFKYEKCKTLEISARIYVIFFFSLKDLRNMMGQISSQD